MCGLKRYTDGVCGHTGQHSAASEQSSLTRGVGSNMASKNGLNVAARFLSGLFSYAKNAGRACPQ